MNDIIRVLALYGGPRRGKNTELLLDAVLEGMKSDKIALEKIVLQEKKISQCVSCYICSSGRGCSIGDDMDEIYSKLLDSDIILFACPIYFGGVPGGAKCMIDRCQAFWCGKHIPDAHGAMKRKRGYFIATGGGKGKDIFKPASATVKLFFRSFNCSYSGEFFVSGTDTATVEGNNGMIEEAAGFGRRISETVNK